MLKPGSFIKVKKFTADILFLLLYKLFCSHNCCKHTDFPAFMICICFCGMHFVCLTCEIAHRKFYEKQVQNNQLEESSKMASREEQSPVRGRSVRCRSVTAAMVGLTSMDTLPNAQGFSFKQKKGNDRVARHEPLEDDEVKNPGLCEYPSSCGKAVGCVAGGCLGCKVLNGWQVDNNQAVQEQTSPERERSPAAPVKSTVDAILAEQEERRRELKANMDARARSLAHAEMIKKRDLERQKRELEGKHAQLAAAEKAASEARREAEEEEKRLRVLEDERQQKLERKKKEPKASALTESE